MKSVEGAATAGLLARVFRVLPGLAMLAHYRHEDLPHDLKAGLSVAAVALPVGVAYAELAGFNPVIGLYSSLLPLVAYALFGSSRQLIVGPDAATCALVAAAVAPMAAGDSTQYLWLSMALTLLAGLVCVGASLLKLGSVADFLSRPILIGFMNGIALSIVLGQLGKILGFKVESGGIVPRLLEIIKKIEITHLPTLAVGIGAFAVLLIAPKLFRRVPAALLTMVLAALAVAGFGLNEEGVGIVGEVSSGLPSLSVPPVPLQELRALLGNAAGIALISFSSLVITARSFAAKNGYDLDIDRDLSALGVANIAAALSQGFAISGADSRTAVNDSAGGRTQVTSLVAAAAIALVLLFATGPFKYVPTPALGAVLVMAAYSLVDVASMKSLWREEKGEFAISLIVMLGVVVAGSIDAIIFAVVLALVRFIRIVSRPRCEVLGRVPGMRGFHDIGRHPEASTIPGLCLFRFNSPLVFFNAPHLKRSVLEAARAAGPELQWFVIDLVPITSHDVTGRRTLVEIENELNARGVTLVLAGRRTEVTNWRRERGYDQPLRGTTLQFETVGQAVRVFGQQKTASELARSEDS